ncbi:MAG: PEP-CTERM sorting domain-containing protein [Planctomycetaceae bacterium]
MRMGFSVRTLLIAYCTCSFFDGHAAIAEAIHYDVLFTSGSGTLLTGGYDDAGNNGIAPLRVFSGEVVGAGTAGPYESAEEPGFRAPNQAFLNSSAMTPSGVFTALPGNTDLFFNLVPMTINGSSRNLFFWNGSGPVNFAALPASYQLGLVGDFGTAAITGSTSEVTANFLLKKTSADGSLDPGHPHLTTQIADAGDAPAQGFYLFAMQFNMAGLSSSAPAYFVYGAYDANSPPDFVTFDAAHAEAEAWVENNLAAVPEPSSLALAGLGAAGVLTAGWGRRRRAAAQNSVLADIAR